MTSFKSLAASYRDDMRLYGASERLTFEAAVLEIAHALKRGRKPTSSSVIAGENIQKWLRRMFVDIHPGDQFSVAGSKCSLGDDVLDAHNGWGRGDLDSIAVCNAIDICRRYIRPIKKVEGDRGDWLYQYRNKVTNLKKKRERHARAQGSWYGDGYCAGYDASHIIRSTTDPIFDRLGRQSLSL